MLFTDESKLNIYEFDWKVWRKLNENVSRSIKPEQIILWNEDQ